MNKILTNNNPNLTTHKLIPSSYKSTNKKRFHTVKNRKCNDFDIYGLQTEVHCIIFGVIFRIIYILKAR